MKGQTMNKVKITWKAFADRPALGADKVTSVELDTELYVTPLEFCNMVFRATNTYHGALWNMIEPKLSPTARTQRCQLAMRSQSMTSRTAASAQAGQSSKEFIIAL